MDSKKILPIAVIGVAIVALIIYAVAFKPASTPQATTATPQAGAYSQQAPQTPQAPQASTNIPKGPVSSKDPATLVPDGMTLDQYCEKYYSAWTKKDWQTAYDMQPISKKTGDVNKFGQDRESYGLVSYQVGKPVINGDVGTVGVTMNLGPNGTWLTNWTFIKNDKGQWTVQDSQTGMSQ